MLACPAQPSKIAGDTPRATRKDRPIQRAEYEMSRSYGICLASSERENTRSTKMMHGNPRATPMAMWRSTDAVARRRR
jgi:hypothetical protein